MSIIGATPATNEFREWLNATTNLIQAVIWPLVIGSFALYWRKEIGVVLGDVPALMRRLKSGKFGPVEVELEKLPPEQVVSLPPPVERPAQVSNEVRQRIFKATPPRDQVAAK